LFISWGLVCCYADVLSFLFFAGLCDFFSDLVTGKLALSLNLGTLVPHGTSEVRCPLVSDFTLTIFGWLFLYVGDVAGTHHVPLNFGSVLAALYHLLVYIGFW
jgi:hypothetical protein